MLSAFVLLTILATGCLLVWPRVANAPIWRATVTPLASIIGSGFLVLGPILDVSYGGFAPLVMVALCVVTFGFGGAIMYNIAQIVTQPDRPQLISRLETMASTILAFAFIK